MVSYLPFRKLNLCDFLGVERKAPIHCLLQISFLGGIANNCASRLQESSWSCLKALSDTSVNGMDLYSSKESEHSVSMYQPQVCPHLHHCGSRLQESWWSCLEAVTLLSTAWICAAPQESEHAASMDQAQVYQCLISEFLPVIAVLLNLVP